MNFRSKMSILALAIVLVAGIAIAEPPRRAARQS